MTELAKPDDDETGPRGTHTSFRGVLVSGHIREIIGDVVGGNKIINNFGNPEFEAQLLTLIQSREASSAARYALASNLIALRLSTLFVDVMRLLYISNGHRIKKANAHLRSHFVERAERDYDQFNAVMQRYADSQLDGAFLENVNAVERTSTWALAPFVSTNPLPRDPRKQFNEMSNAGGRLHEVLQSADAKGIGSTVELVDHVGTVLQDTFSRPRGFARVDDIAMLRFAMQTEALRRLQANAPDQIFSIDDDVKGIFSPLYCIIDRWLLDRCRPWN